MEQFHLLFCLVSLDIQGQEPIVWCISLQNSHFDPNFTLDPESLHKCPQPLVTAQILSHLGSECSRNSSESTLNLYFNQRATCYCSSSFYSIFRSCSSRNIVSFIRINSRMFVLTLLKHNFHILQLLPERSWRIMRGCIHFIILSLFFVLKFTMPSNILLLTLNPKHPTRWPPERSLISQACSNGLQSLGKETWHRWWVLNELAV